MPMMDAFLRSGLLAWCLEPSALAKGIYVARRGDGQSGSGTFNDFPSWLQQFHPRPRAGDRGGGCVAGVADAVIPPGKLQGTCLMKRFYSTLQKGIAVLLLGSGSLGAQCQGSFVVPGFAATHDAGNSIFGPMLSTSDPKTRIQQVMSSSDIALPFGPFRITAVSFRLDSGPTSLNAVVPDMEIRLSTTTKAVDRISGTFAWNEGADVVSVVSRGSVRLTGRYDPALSVQPFSVRIPFTTPFVYDRSFGNLLLDIITYRSGNVVVAWNAAGIPADSISSVLSGSNLAEGLETTYGLVAQFEYQPIPEPRTMLLLVVVACALLAHRPLSSIGKE